MRMSKRYIWGAVALAVAGTCVAEAATVKVHHEAVRLPDGSVMQVSYVGDVAPRVAVQPVAEAAAVDTLAGPIAVDPMMARMAQVSAMMDRQADAMFAQMAALRQAALTQAAPGAPGVVTADLRSGAALPKGVHMTYISSSTDAKGCTHTVSYRSDGSGAAPEVTQAASDGCDAAKAAPTAIPARAEHQGAPATTPATRT